METHRASELDERSLALTRADDGLGSHNPKVAGSNPAPATQRRPWQIARSARAFVVVRLRCHSCLSGSFIQPSADAGASSPRSL